MTEYKNVLVTGGARRVGQVLSLELARVGWTVIVHYHRAREEAEGVVERIRQGGGRATTINADLTDKKVSALHILEKASEAFGPVTCLVNNAAIFYQDRLATATEKSWRDHIETNLEAPVFLCQAFAQTLPKTMKGCMINFLDQKLKRLTPDFFSYTVSKAGLWAITRMLAIELAPHIRVNGIAPGLILRSGEQTEEQFQKVHKNTPLRIGPQLSDIVRTLLFLIDSPCITGQMILLDGGKHLVTDPYIDDLGIQ